MKKGVWAKNSSLSASNTRRMAANISLATMGCVMLYFDPAPSATMANNVIIYIVAVFLFPILYIIKRKQ